MTQEEYSKMLADAKDQFKSGKPLFGKDGAFHRVLEDFLNAALEGEMDSHLAQTKTPASSNRRNGKMPKEVQTEYGPVNIETPRDRNGSFSPEVVQKRQHDINVYCYRHIRTGRVSYLPSFTPAVSFFCSSAPFR